MKTLLGRHKLLLFLFLLLVIAGGTIIFLAAITSPTHDPIRIGFANTLTGKASTWGVPSRNGVILAIEQANEAGGINGRPIELLIRDDQADPKIAVLVDKELMDEGVVAILGHFLSTVAVNVVDQSNARKIMIMGLSSTTSQLTGRDDYLLRISLPINIRVPLAAKHTAENLKWKNVAIVLDESNPNYTIPTANTFEKTLEEYGGKVAKRIGFNPTKKDFNAPEIAEEVARTNADGVFIITNGIHGALICQHLRKKGSKMGILMGGWAFSDPNFIKNGGKAVNGALCFSVYNADSSSKGFKKLQADYDARFGEGISEAAQNGYDAARVVIEALKVNDDPKQLPKTIITKQFEGTDCPISFDKFGDAIRPVYVLQIQDGKKVTIEKILPGK